LLAAAATRLHQPQLTDPGTGEICAQRERDRGLRVIIIDESAARAAVIEEGLREAGVTDIRILTDRVGMIAAIAAAEPDVVLMNLENPSRDVLEESFLISRSLRKPIALFVDQSDAETMMAAIDAGVSAYVVDGFRKERVKPIVDLAVRRFQAFSRLQDELAEARSQLAERKTIDQAKAILMRKRGISEPEAYKLLRSHAMATNRRVAEVAQALITADAMLGRGL
jgi:response regulator NasT